MRLYPERGKVELDPLARRRPQRPRAVAVVRVLSRVSRRAHRPVGAVAGGGGRWELPAADRVGGGPAQLEA